MRTQVSETYLAEADRLRIVADYLRHEAGKMDGCLYTTSHETVSHRTSEWHAEQLDRLRGTLSGISSFEEKQDETVRFLTSLPLDERWVLFHAVSCGCLRKELANCVGHPGLQWAFEQRPLCEIEFESKVGPLQKLSGDHPSILDAVEFLRSFMSSDGKPHNLRDPLIGRQYGQRVRIHDGNGRLLSCAYAIRDGRMLESESLNVWVGHPRKQEADDDIAYGNARSTVFAKTNTIDRQ